MRLWFAPGSDVPVYRQLATQVSLAILSGELKPGEKLPSTRELARRFAIHPNTISAGYKQLEREGWTERRQGSGVYVKRKTKTARTPQQILDAHIFGFFKAVRELELPREVVRARVAEWLEAPQPDHFLVIDPDARLRQILVAEIEAAGLPAREVDIAGCRSREELATAVPVCRPSKTELVRATLPAGVELLTLPIRSANALLAPWLPFPAGSLIGVASHWPDFLAIAHTMLIATGVPAEALVSRDANQPGWQQGLELTVGILCDVYTARGGKLPDGPTHIVFALISDDGCAELRRFPLA